MNVLSGQVYDHVCGELLKTDGNYFEIGVFNGTGFARVARENPTKKCYAVDPFIEDGHTQANSGQTTGDRLNQQKENYLTNTKDLNNVILYEMTSSAFARQLTDQLAKEMNVSVVTIDGDHHYEHVVIDFEIAIRLLNHLDGRIIVDDTDVPGVQMAFAEFKEKFKTRIVEEINAGGSCRVLILKALNDSN